MHPATALDGFAAKGMHMHEMVGWSGETPDMFFATIGADGSGLKHHMIVEALPNGGWDWVAWAGDGSGRSIHGAEPHRMAAMISAECAAVLLRIWLAPVRSSLHTLH